MIFENPFTNELHGDELLTNTRRQVHNAYYSRVFPTPTAAPKTLAVSEEVCLLLGIKSDAADSIEFAEIFSGNAVTTDMDPHAMCYGGHQFGNWAGQLGDGRAINLGQVTGIDCNSYMLQLKGAGPTPYSQVVMEEQSFGPPLGNIYAVRLCTTLAFYNAHLVFAAQETTLFEICFTMAISLKRSVRLCAV